MIDLQKRIGGKTVEQWIQDIDIGSGMFAMPEEEVIFYLYECLINALEESAEFKREIEQLRARVADLEVVENAADVLLFEDSKRLAAIPDWICYERLMKIAESNSVRAMSAALINISRALRASRTATVNIKAKGSDLSGGDQPMVHAGNGDDRLIDPVSINSTAAPEAGQLYEGLQPVDPALLAEFKEAMQNETIPSILEAVRMRQRAAAQYGMPKPQARAELAAQQSFRQHWLEVAYERLQAGESEVEVLKDYGYVQPAEGQEPVAWRVETPYDNCVRFHIGNQSFTLDYHPEDEDAWTKKQALDWMKDMLQKALSRLAQPQRPADHEHLVPGVMRCAKCKLQLTRTNLYVNSGTTGPGNSETEPCPNGCGPLWPVTWKQWAEEGWQTAERYFDELKKEVSGPTFMGEPSLQPQRPAVPDSEILIRAASILSARADEAERVGLPDMSDEFLSTASFLKAESKRPLTAAPAPERPKPRFEMTYCSQCGAEQGPGDEGVSRCSDHRR